MHRCVATARGEQLQSLVQACHHGSQAQQRQARCGKSDGQRQPFEAAAQFDHQAQVCLLQFEVPIPGTGLIDEQRHRTTAARLVERRSGRGHVQGRQPEHVLRLDVQRGLARHQHTQARRRVEHRPRQARNPGDKVFGVVEHQQCRYRCQGGQQARQWVAALGDRQAERPGHGGGQQQRVGQLGQIDPGCLRRRRHSHRSSDRDGRLAHAAGTDDGEQPVLRHQRAQIGQVSSAAKQRAACGGKRRRALRAPIQRGLHRGQQQVAPARGGPDDPVPVAAEGRPQIADGPRERSVGHHPTGPHGIEQLGFGHQLAYLTQQQGQYGPGLRPQGDRRSAGIAQDASVEVDDTAGQHQGRAGCERLMHRLRHGVSA